LPEMLVGMVILGVITSVAVPQSRASENGSKEAKLRKTLELVRRAIHQFRADTGVFPAQIEDLTRLKNPGIGLDLNGDVKPSEATRWNGPYLNSVPHDPMNWGVLGYSTKAPTVGELTSNHKGQDRNEIAFTDY